MIFFVFVETLDRLEAPIHHLFLYTIYLPDFRQYGQSGDYRVFQRQQLQQLQQCQQLQYNYKR